MGLGCNRADFGKAKPEQMNSVDGLGVLIETGSGSDRVGSFAAPDRRSKNGIIKLAAGWNQSALQRPDSQPMPGFGIKQADKRSRKWIQVQHGGNLAF